MGEQCGIIHTSQISLFGYITFGEVYGTRRVISLVADPSD